MQRIGDSNRMPIARRRSVTIDKTVDDTIKTLRVGALQEGIELDYTTALNIMAEYGLRKMANRPPEGDPMLTEVFRKYLFYDELKEAAILDMWKELQEFKEWKEKQALDKKIPL